MGSLASFCGALAAGFAPVLTAFGSAAFASILVFAALSAPLPVSEGLGLPDFAGVLVAGFFSAALGSAFAATGGALSPSPTERKWARGLSGVF